MWNRGINYYRQMGCFLKMLSYVGVIIIVFFLTKFGYCQNWWLQNNVWAYYGWGCDCGAEFERNLYPDHIEVIFSACESPDLASLSADGRYMHVSLAKIGSPYLLDLVTGERWLWPYYGQYRVSGKDQFITDTIIRVNNKQSKPKYLDILTGNVVPETSFGIREEGEDFTVPDEMMQFIEKAEQVILHEQSNGIIAFNDKPCQEGCEVYTLGFYSIQEEQMKALLTEKGIDYELARFCGWRTGCPSANGKFMDGWEKIYLKDDPSRPIISLDGSPSFALIGIGGTLGWVHDDSGIYIHLGNRKIIPGDGFVSNGWFQYALPIIKLKIPEQYLTETY